MNFEQQDITNVLKYYLVEPTTAHWRPLGNGHINQTFLVTSGDYKFVLQKLNHHVFPNPQAVVNNAVQINEFLRGQSDYAFASIAPIKNNDGNYLLSARGSYWRAIEFIEHSTSVDAINDIKQAHEAANAFATFSSSLASFDPSTLTPVIDKFHDLNHRVELFEQALINNSAGRADDIGGFVEQIKAETDFIDNVTRLVKSLPLRVTHNDTKINNLLFNQLTMAPLAIIDLDTCMPGYLLHDFGDMVRTCCSNLSEDATNLEDMEFKRNIYDALYQGYLTGARDVITALEIESLSIGAKLMPFLLTLRFLTDYLDGDKYFNVKHEHHNLDRAKNQFKLYQLLGENLQ